MTVRRPARCPRATGSTDSFGPHCPSLCLAIGLRAACVRDCRRLGCRRLVGRFEPGLIATALAVLVLLYDGLLKPTFLAPLAMGGCRTLNVLLGMSAAAADLPQLQPGTAWQIAGWLVAAGIGVYIAGVTWFARTEADTSHRGQLLAGTLVMLCGVGLVGWYPAWIEPPLAVPQQWTLFWLLICAIVGVRCGRAILDPRAGMVQLAVKNCLLSLIVIDAAAVLAIDGTFWACMVLLLVVPAMLLGRAGFLRPKPGAGWVRLTAPGVAVGAKRLQIDRHRLAQDQAAHDQGRAGRQLQAGSAVTGG